MIYSLLIYPFFTLILRVHYVLLHAYEADNIGESVPSLLADFMRMRVLEGLSKSFPQFVISLEATSPIIV